MRNSNRNIKSKHSHCNIFHKNILSQVSLFFWLLGKLIWPFCEFFHILLCFVHLSCVFLFVHVGVSENWRDCLVTSSDSATPRRSSTTPTTRCCLGCGPTASPTCQGTGTHPRHLLQPHSTYRQVAERRPPLTQRHPNTLKTVTTGTYRRIHSTGVQRESTLTASGAFCMDESRI